MGDTETAEPGRDEPKRRRGKLRLVLAWTGAGVALLSCIGCVVLALLLDRTALAANIYLQAVSGENKGLALLLGDYYSTNAEGQRGVYELDIERDISWLGGAVTSEVVTTREETLSGQGVTVIRFKWRPENSVSAPQEAALRVKTERWFMVTYIRTVEIIGPYP